MNTRTVPGWDAYYLNLAEAAKLRSKDPITQVGAVIVNADNRIVSLGYNGMPQGADEYDLWDNKDEYVLHAEVNALANAARNGTSVLGGTLYVTLTPCIGCARSIIAAGIEHVVVSLDNHNNRCWLRPQFEQSSRDALEFMLLSGVTWSMT